LGASVNTALRFEPFLRPMVWGGRQLGEVLGKPLPNGGLYGEAWEISDHASHHSIVADGPYRGHTLRVLMERDRQALLGPAADRHATFPWLVKLLDCWDWLSVQVHPDEEDVLRLWPGEGSKTEAWFILAATPDSRIYAGLKPGVDEAVLRRALANRTAADCLHQFHPQPGDCVFLPAGTVHAVGGGVLMAEVQQTSDATFRLYDWDRRDAQGRMRQLHVEEAMACIDWQAGPVHPVHATDYSSALEDRPAQALGQLQQTLVQCPYFTLEYVRRNDTFTLGGSGQLQVVLVLHGSGSLMGDNHERPLRTGDTLLLPAAASLHDCRPTGAIGLLVATLPT
jgi:mannose-6-phosphate isomerase